jgi:hypothetical protein
LVETGVQCPLRRLAGPRGRRWVGHRFHCLNIHVTKLIQPEVVDSVCRGHEVALGQLTVGLHGTSVQLVKDPALNEALLASRLMAKT